MHAYTKADYYSLYGAAPIDPITRRRYTEIRLHYHPAIRKVESYRGMTQKIIDKYNLDSSSKVLVIGCAFGWLCEDLINKCNCQCIGTEISTYIHDTKGTSADDELISAIEASKKCNFTYKSGIGKEIFDKFQDPSPRSSVTILNTACDTTESVQMVMAHIRPTLVVTEEMWQLLDAKENTDMNESISKFGCPIAHIIDGQLV